MHLCLWWSPACVGSQNQIFLFSRFCFGDKGRHDRSFFVQACPPRWFSKTNQSFLHARANVTPRMSARFGTCTPGTKLVVATVHVWNHFKHILGSEKCTVFQQVSECGHSSQQSERRETQHCSHYLLNQYLPDYVKYQPSKRDCATENSEAQHQVYLHGLFIHKFSQILNK